VTTTKRINRNLMRKETSFVCYTSSVLIQISTFYSRNLDTYMTYRIQPILRTNVQTFSVLHDQACCNFYYLDTLSWNL